MTVGKHIFQIELSNSEPWKSNGDMKIIFLLAFLWAKTKPTNFQSFKWIYTFFQWLIVDSALIFLAKHLHFLIGCGTLRQYIDCLELEQIDTNSDLWKFTGTSLQEPDFHFWCATPLDKQESNSAPSINAYFFVPQTQLEPNCNIPVPLLRKKGSLACQQTQTGMQGACSEQLCVSHSSWGSITCHMPVTITSESRRKSHSIVRKCTALYINKRLLLHSDLVSSNSCSSSPQTNSSVEFWWSKVWFNLRRFLRQRAINWH